MYVLFYTVCFKIETLNSLYLKKFQILLKVYVYIYTYARMKKKESINYNNFYQQFFLSNKPVCLLYFITLLEKTIINSILNISVGFIQIIQL